MYYIEAFILSLAVSLFSVYISHRLRYSRELNATFNGLLSEITFNLVILESVKKIVVKDLESIKKGSITIFPMPTLHTSAFLNLMMRGMYFKLHENIRRELDDIYTYFKVINECISRHERLKFGVERALSGSLKLLEINCKMMLSYINEVEDRIIKFQRSIGKFKHPFK